MTTTTRYRQDVLRDLSMINAKIASNRKTADLTSNPKTASICDAVYPSLLRRLGELRLELQDAADRPAQAVSWSLPDGCTAAPQAIMMRTTPLDDHELAALDIPAFLRR